MRRKKILVIINKSWECEPFMEAVKECGFLDRVLADTEGSDQEEQAAEGQSPRIRGAYRLRKEDVIIRCIEDLMDPGKGKSNSQEKHRVLPKCIRADAPDLVISVSTAESTPEAQNFPEAALPDGKSLNGCVLVGGQYFMYDAREYDPASESKLDVATFDILKYDEALFETFQGLSGEVYEKFLEPPHHPAKEGCVLAASKYGCVGVVNVEHYEKYEEADPAAYEKYDKDKKLYPPMSIETTHGIVRMSTPDDTPVIFVSPVVDRYKSFSEDVEGDQNHHCAYNSGVAVSGYLWERNK